MKNKSKLKIFFTDPIMIITLFAMILSTSISLLLVSENNFKIDKIKAKIDDKKTKIRELSNNINEKNSQVNSLILLKFVIDNNSKEMKQVKEKYLESLPNIDYKSSAIEILEEFHRYYENTSNQIDNFYIEQIYLEKESSILEQKNKTYSSIAALLQVIGLTLIIIKDSKKTY